MVQLRDRVKEFSESGHLETQETLETQLLTDLVSKLQAIDHKDHLEFVRVRGQIESLKTLRLRRGELLEEDED